MYRSRRSNPRLGNLRSKNFELTTKANNRRDENGNPTAKTTRVTNKRVRVIKPSKGLSVGLV
jgi:hypothetical protein